MGQMLPFVDFNGTRWAIVGPWVEVYGDEIAFEQSQPCDAFYYLTFYEAAWAGFIEKWEPLGENI